MEKTARTALASLSPIDQQVRLSELSFLNWLDLIPVDRYNHKNHAAKPPSAARVQRKAGRIIVLVDLLK